MRLNSKFDIIEIIENYGISEEELLKGFIYWLDITEVENMFKDFLNDRDIHLEDEDKEEEDDA